MTVYTVQCHQFAPTIAQGATVVKFTADWCTNCKTMEPKYQQFSKQFPHVRFLSIDVDECENVADHFNVESLPTFMAFVNGQRVGPRVRGENEAELYRLIRSVSN